MNIDKTSPQPQIGTWAKLSTEEIEKKPKVTFDVNIPIEVKFKEDEPKEYQGESGVYYIFEVESDGEEKVILTSAWTLLRGLKQQKDLKGKKIRITKKLIKGKQQFIVEKVD